MRRGDEAVSGPIGKSLFLDKRKESWDRRGERQKRNSSPFRGQVRRAWTSGVECGVRACVVGGLVTGVGRIEGRGQTNEEFVQLLLALERGVCGLGMAARTQKQDNINNELP
jgi:hypothetical protein